MLSLIWIYVLPSREKSSSKSGDVRRKMNSSAKQILIGWIYRRIGFLKRGMKKQIKPLAAILRFLDFSIPPIPSFRAQREIFLALCSFLLPSQKVSHFPLSHIGRYTGVQERSRASLGMTLREYRSLTLPIYFPCNNDTREAPSTFAALLFFMRRTTPLNPTT